MAEEFAVKIRDNAHIYIHNTLENAAWYLKEKIEARKRAGNVCFQWRIRHPVVILLAARLTHSATSADHFCYNAQCNCLT
jgi:hypothetical protein